MKIAMLAHEKLLVLLLRSMLRELDYCRVIEAMLTEHRSRWLSSRIRQYWGKGMIDQPERSELDARVSRVEADIAAMKTDLAVIRSNYVTKEDLHREISAQTWRLVTFVSAFASSFGIALVGATYFIVSHLK